MCWNLRELLCFTIIGTFNYYVLYFVCISILKTTMHYLLLKMSVRIFCANCVSSGLLDI